MRIRRHALRDRREILGEGRHVDVHVLQRQENTVVLQRMMAAAHDAVTVAAAVADDLHVEIVEADVVADLLERPTEDEGCDRVGPALLAQAGHARSHRDHVLLGDPGVDETLAHARAQGFERHEAEIAGEEDDRAFAVAIADRIAEGAPHATTSSRAGRSRRLRGFRTSWVSTATSSRIAASYCRSSSGR